MQLSAATGASAAACWLALLATLGAAERSHSLFKDLKHNVFKRSANSSDVLKSETVEDILGEPVSATEDSISATEINEEMSNNDRSGAYASTLSDLDAALSAAQPGEPGTAPPPAADSDKSTLHNLSSEHDSDNVETSTFSAAAVNDTQRQAKPTENSDTLRRNNDLGTGYDAMSGGLATPNAQVFPVSSNPNLRAQPPIFQGSFFHNPNTLQSEPHSNKLIENILESLGQSPSSPYSGNINPYNLQSLLQSQNQNLIRDMRAPALLATMTGAGPAAAPQPRPYLPAFSPAQVLPVNSFTASITNYPRRVISQDEKIFLETIPGAENLVTCTREGEFYSLPLEECLMCACVHERGRVQPVCARCACATPAPLAPLAAPAAPPGLLIDKEAEAVAFADTSPVQTLHHPELPDLAPQPKQDIGIPGPEEACSPLPYALPFEHPLNPCQICICQKKNLWQNQVFVSCKKDPQCVKPSDIPTLPTSIIPTPIPSPQCEKFPKYVEFPHPSEPCQACKCVESVSPLGVPQQQIQCTKDRLCSDIYGPATSYEPYKDFAKSTDYPRPIVQEKEPYIPLETKPGEIPQSPLSPELIDEPEGLFLAEKPELEQTPERMFELPQSDAIHLGPPWSQKPVIFEFPQSPSLQYVPKRFENLNGDEPSLPFTINPPRGPAGYQINPDVLRPDALEVLPSPELQQEALSWPPLTRPAYDPTPRRERGPLLGPPPHESCAPYPADLPFQHPWDDCRLCVCAEFASPGHVSVEVNCYTKPSCCVEPPVSLPSSVAEQQNLISSPQFIETNPTELLILDEICELKSFGVEFVNPRDRCAVCACLRAGRFVVPVCRSAGAHCKKETAPAPLALIKYIEPRCRRQSPLAPFVSRCALCTCHVVFTFVVAKCTPIPKCVNQQQVKNNVGIQDILVPANLAIGGGDSQTNIGSLANYAEEPLSASASIINTNPLARAQANSYYQYKQDLLNKLIRYQQGLQNTPPGPNSMLPFYNPNSFIRTPSLEQKTNFWLQQLARPVVSTSAPNVKSEQAFIDTINSAYEEYSQPTFAEILNLQSRSGPATTVEATSGIYPINNDDYLAQQTSNPQQNYFSNYPKSNQIDYLLGKSTEGSTYAYPDNLSSNSKTNLQDWNLNQLEAGTSPSSETLSSTYQANSNSYPYSSQRPTFYPADQSLLDSTTLAQDQGDSSARALLRALAGAGAGAGDGALITRTGRGLCQYAGDRYHRSCQACYCFADENIPGDIYSMCLGHPCE